MIKVPIKWNIRKAQPSASGQINPKGELESVWASPREKKRLEMGLDGGRKEHLQAEVESIEDIESEDQEDG